MQMDSFSPFSFRPPLITPLLLLFSFAYDARLPGEGESRELSGSRGSGPQAEARMQNGGRTGTSVGA
ncbi:hypothetical protein PBY51_002438 [Eleginops maclovinus]|uniref:Uncharacterized protein n=1 Tax=Eleginops maclovinus TaxID=56733 RepID=A0AAN7XCM3_ELEMC|nr:hypothetical protein PBY51_002438 [Eleginops maclovinus]